MATAPTAAPTGAQLESLCDVIVALFDDYDALKMFAWTKLELKLSAVVTDAGQGMTEIALALVEWAGKSGSLAALINQLWIKKPSETRLETLADALGIALRDKPAFEPSELTGLATAARDAGTKNVMQRYRTDIVSLCAIATKLGALKFLHDRVDHMRRTVYVPLASVITRMPAPDTRGEIREYRTTLDDLVRDITGKVAAAELTESDVPWVGESLVPAQSALRDAALNWPAVPPLRAVVEWLSDVTGPKLADLNGQIKGRADGMSNLNFPGRMAEMQAAVAPGLPGDGDREKLDDDLERLNAAIAGLIALVIEHDRWQRIKDLTFGLVDMMNRPVGESKYQWPTLDRLMGTVAKGAIYPAPDTLFQAQADVGAVFATDGLDQGQPSNALTDAVDKLRSFTGDQFYTVDKNLLSNCEYVGKLGDRLKQVVEALDG